MEAYKNTPTKLMLESLERGESPEQIVIKEISLAEYLNFAIGRRGLPLTVLAELSAINRATMYRILSGELTPGRNVLIRLCLILELNFFETQDFLKCGGKAQLSGQRKRDRYISDAIIHQWNIDDLDQQLIRNGMTGIYSKNDQ